MFVDQVEVYVKAGDGGNGAVAFRREKYVPRGGPSGGDGGRGGSVIAVADEAVHTLMDFRYQKHLKAKNGRPGGSSNKTGADGEDLIIKVPVIIGYPNAGKSTLLSRISAARPKIADYPFTTLAPVLGVVQVDHDSFVAADIPGLIEGASQGLGLGHQFLRHIMRTRLLVHVVDVSEHSGRDPLSDWENIREELRLYDPSLADRPEIVAANKCDLPGSSQRAALLRARLEPAGTKVFEISAVTGEGVGKLLYAVREELAKLPPPQPLAEPEAEVVEYVARGPRLREVTIHRDGDVFVVSGEGVERLLVRTDIDNEAAMARFSGMLEKAGIYQLLREHGMKPGDTIRIGDEEFIYCDEFDIDRD